MNNTNSLIIKKGQLKTVGQMAVGACGFTIKWDHGRCHAKDSAWHSVCPPGQAGVQSQARAKGWVPGLGAEQGPHWSLGCRPRADIQSWDWDPERNTQFDQEPIWESQTRAESSDLVIWGEAWGFFLGHRGRAAEGVSTVGGKRGWGSWPAWAQNRCQTQASFLPFWS